MDCRALLEGENFFCGFSLSFFFSLVVLFWLPRHFTVLEEWQQLNRNDETFFFRKLYTYTHAHTTTNTHKATREGDPHQQWFFFFLVFFFFFSCTCIRMQSYASVLFWMVFSSFCTTTRFTNASRTWDGKWLSLQFFFCVTFCFFFFITTILFYIFLMMGPKRIICCSQHCHVT